jgi:hypothetical protein
MAGNQVAVPLLHWVKLYTLIFQSAQKSAGGT